MSFKERIKGKLEDYRREKEKEKKLEDEIYERKRYAREMEAEKERNERKREKREERAEFRASGGIGGVVKRGLAKGGENLKANTKYYGKKAGKLAIVGFKKASKGAYEGLKRQMKQAPRRSSGSQSYGLGLNDFDIFGGQAPRRSKPKKRKKSRSRRSNDPFNLF